MSEDKTIIGEVRYSRDMRLPRAITLGLGVGLGVGVFVLLGPIAEWTSTRAPMVYLVAAALFLPIVLSMAELAAASGPGGVYRLIRDSKHQLFTYLVGWALLGGGIALGALLARGCADYLSAIAVSLLDLSLSPHWLGLGVVLLLTANNILGSRENRWWQNVIILTCLATVLIVSAWAWLRSPSSPPTAGQQLAGNMTAAVAVLSASLWGLVLILAAGEEMRHMQRDVPRALLATLGVTTVVGALGAAAIPLETDPSLADAAARVGGLIAQGWVLVVGVIILAATLNRTMLALSRIGVDMSREGFLPRWFRVTHPQFHTPYRLLALGGVLIALASLYSDLLLLAALAGLGLLCTAVLSNLHTVLSRDGYLPDKRPLALPFSPLIPGFAAAISLFLLTTMPPYALAVGGVWSLIGVVFFLVHGQRGAVAARTGVTVFREEPGARSEAKYRILVPMANPATAEVLISAGSAIARVRGGEVLALQVVVVPEQTSLRAGRRAARQRWSFLDRAVKRAQAVGVPVHPIVRIAHSPVEGILDTAREEDCDLILMGWHGEPTPQTYNLGPVIDPVVIQAPCDVAVLKGDLPDRLKRILIPTAGGPHAPVAVQIGLDLAVESEAEVIALNLIRGPVNAVTRQQAQANIDHTLADVEDAQRVGRRIVHAEDIKRGIIEAAADCDLILLGASEEGLLDQIKFGGLPEDVARACPQPVVLVKHYRGLSQFWLRRLWRGLYALFPNLDRPEQIEVYRTMRRGARPDVDFFVLIVLSSVIATLGLLQNSAAVIIGAMLVAPLMTPILSLSLGLVQGDIRLLRLALESALKGVTLAIAVAIGAVLLTPHSQLTSEILARTHPTLLDLIVALASGAAGAYAIARKEVAAALPGVAIAAALVPPLCVVGAGIALGRPEVAGGAILLFATNLIAISMAGAVIFLLLGFRPTPHERERQRRFRQGLAVSLVLLVAISIPLGLLLVQTVRDGQRQQTVNQVLAREAPALGASLADTELERDGKGFQVVATFFAPQPPTRSTVKRLQDELSREIGAPVSLEIVVVPVARVPAE